MKEKQLIDKAAHDISMILSNLKNDLPDCVVFDVTIKREKVHVKEWLDYYVEITGVITNGE